MTSAVHIVARRRLDRTRRRTTTGNRIARVLVVLFAPIAAIATTATVAALVVATTTVSVMSSGLPEPDSLSQLSFSQPTIVYDRAAKVELGRFQRERRRVVEFDQVPQLILDATTTAEDRTFWANAGVDPAAIVSAAAGNVSGLNERGASTITQQLVRARLLPEEAVGAGSDRYVRKVKEILQALRVNGEYPGETGKERVITAYLNEIFYGHDAYGIAAAASTYFGITDLDKLTPAQAALLAGIPKSPSLLDPYRYAKQDKKGRWLVPADAAPVIRRNWILRDWNTGARWTTLSDEELKAALEEPVVLSGVPPLRVRGGHFTWQVRRELEAILPDIDIETGGYRVITTLDWKAQKLAMKWLESAVIAPNVSRSRMTRIFRRNDIPRGDRAWIRRLRGKDLHNASLVALDYRTGDVLAYVGSAGYDRDDLKTRKFEPKYDAAGDGARQPGSAWKPILYASAFDRKRLTPGSVLLDITTEFNRAEDWAPRDADRLERGPVLVRQALQYSLNIPAIRALERVGNKRVAKDAEAMGVDFLGGTDAFLGAGLAGALGTVEVRPLDLTAAYGTIANGGVHIPSRMILEVRGPDGRTVWKAPKPEGERAISRAAAYLVTDILAGNTNPRINQFWGPILSMRNTRNGSRRPAAAKTGTANDARDLATYGYLAPPKGSKYPGLAVGIWMGNSDHSNPRSRNPAISLTAAAPLWQAFVRQYTKNWPVAKFQRPKGVVKRSIDAFSGGRPGPWTRRTTSEWFIAGTQPGAKKAVDQDGLLYSRGCAGWMVDPLKAELGPRSWDGDVANWARRARGGSGSGGGRGSRTAYLWGRGSWGGPIAGGCSAPRPDRSDEKPDKDKPDEKPGNGPPADPPEDPPNDDDG